MSTTPDYGEPWRLENTCPSISISERPYEGERCVIVCDKGAKLAALERAVSCVNSMQGIPDPKSRSFTPAAAKALLVAIEGLEDVAALKPNEFYRLVAEDAEKQLEYVRQQFTL